MAEHRDDLTSGKAENSSASPEPKKVKIPSKVNLKADSSANAESAESSQPVTEETKVFTAVGKKSAPANGSDSVKPSKKRSETQNSSEKASAKKAEKAASPAPKREKNSWKSRSDTEAPTDTNVKISPAVSENSGIAKDPVPEDTAPTTDSSKAESQAEASARAKASWRSKTTQAGNIDASDDRRHVRKEYDARRAQHAKKRSPLRFLPYILGVIILGVGIFALVHFVIMPKLAESGTQSPAVSEAEPSAATASTATEEAVDPTAPTESEFAVMAEDTMKSMTLREKICQILMVTPEVLTGSDLVTEAGETTENALEEYPVGGLYYSPQNFSGDDQVRSMLSTTQGFSDIPLFFAVNDDAMAAPGQGGEGPGGPGGGPGGPGEAPAGGPGGPSGDPDMPDDSDSDSVTTPEDAYDNALEVSANKKDVGFNVDFSVVADISDISDDEDGLTVDDICSLLSSAVKGYNEGGLISSAKYFPLTPDDSDSSEGLPHTDRTAAELTDSELLPFRSGIDAGVGMIMVGHVIVDELDDEKPATLSDKVVPQLLRGKLGYQGVTVTDNMSADAFTREFSYSTIVKGIFASDIDLILNPNNIDEYISAIENAIDDGDITEEQLDLKVKRVLTLKYEKGLILNTN